MKTNDGEIHYDYNEDVNNVNANSKQTCERNEGTQSRQKSKLSSSLLSGIASAVAGMTGGAILQGFVLRPEDRAKSDAATPSIPEHPPVSEPAQFNGENVPVAHNVNDDMSFGKAFAAARTEVGAGGVFEWRGKVFGTYYKDEWESFSDNYRHQFSNYNYDAELKDDHKTKTAQVINNDGGEIIINNTGGKITINNTGENGESITDIPVTGIHLEAPENISLEDGTNVTVTCLYDGTDSAPLTAFVDVDNDGIYDAQVFPDGSVAPLTEPMTYEELQTAARQGDLLIVNSDIPLSPIPLDDDDDDVFVLYDEVEGHQVAYAPATINGEDVLFVDGVLPDGQGGVVAAPLDGNYDVAIMNDPETGEMTTFDLTGQGVTNDYIRDARDDPAAIDFTPENNSDFNNNADVNTFNT
jgi:hypothetical protein